MIYVNDKSLRPISQERLHFRKVAESLPHFAHRHGIQILQRDSIDFLPELDVVVILCILMTVHQFFFLVLLLFLIHSLQQSGFVDEHFQISSRLPADGDCASVVLPREGAQACGVAEGARREVGVLGQHGEAAGDLVVGELGGVEFAPSGFRFGGC